MIYSIIYYLMMKTKNNFAARLEGISRSCFSTKTFKMIKPIINSNQTVNDPQKIETQDISVQKNQPRIILKDVSQFKMIKSSSSKVKIELIDDYKKKNLETKYNNMFNLLHSTNNRSIQNFIREAFKLQIDLENASKALRVQQEIKNCFAQIKEKISIYENLIETSANAATNHIQAQIKGSTEYISQLIDPYLVKEAEAHVSLVISRNSMLSLNTVLQPELKNEEINKLRCSFEILIANKQFNKLDEFILFISKSNDSQSINKLLSPSTINLILHEDLSSNNCLRFINLVILKLIVIEKEGLKSKEVTELIDTVKSFDLNSLAKNGYLQRYTNSREILKNYQQDPLFLFINLYSEGIFRKSIENIDFNINFETLALAFSVYSNQENIVDTSIKISMNLGKQSDFLNYLYLNLLQIENQGSIPYGYNEVATHNSYLKLKQMNAQLNKEITDNILTFFERLFNTHNSEYYLEDLHSNWFILSNNNSNKSDAFSIFSAKHNSRKNSKKNFFPVYKTVNPNAIDITIKAIIDSTNDKPSSHISFKKSIQDILSEKKRAETKMVSTITEELTKKLKETTNNTNLNLTTTQKKELYQKLITQTYKLIEDVCCFDLEKTRILVKQYLDVMNNTNSDSNEKLTHLKANEIKTLNEATIKEFVDDCKSKEHEDLYKKNLLKLKIFYLDSDERVQTEIIQFVNKFLKSSTPIFSIEELKNLELSEEQKSKLIEGERYERQYIPRDLINFFDDFLKFIKSVPLKVKHNLSNKLLENQLQLEKLKGELETKPKDVEGYKVFSQKSDELIKSISKAFSLHDISAIKSEFDKLEKLFLAYYSIPEKYKSSQLNNYLLKSRKNVSSSNLMRNLLYNKYKVMTNRLNSQSYIANILSSKKFSFDFNQFYSPNTFIQNNVSIEEFNQKFNPFRQIVNSQVSKLNYQISENELSHILEEVDENLLNAVGLNRTSKRIVDLLSDSENLLSHLKSDFKVKAGYDLNLANELILFGLKSKNSTSKAIF